MELNPKTGRYKSIKTKLIVRFTLLFSLLFVIIQGIILYNFRHVSLEASKDKAYSVAQLIRDTLTSFMVLDVIHQRDVFIDNLRDTQGIKDIRILRGEPVSRQFGPPRESEHPEKDIEWVLLRTGEQQEKLTERLYGVEYELVIPYKASSQGKINCMACHNVHEGELLGGVSITMDLTQQRTFGLSIIAIMSVVSMLFFTGVFYVIVRFFQPYNNLFHRLNLSFRRIEDGYLNERVDSHLNDEAGAVADGVNKMTERLSATLFEIRQKAAVLIGHQPSRTGNALKDTSSMVDELVNIYNFKRTIEHDRSKNEIYMRIEKIIQDLKIFEFSIYEINSSDRSINCLASRGAEHFCSTTSKGESGKYWCSNAIFHSSDECRACRTGTEVDSGEFPRVCPSFLYNEETLDNSMNYCCIPFYIGAQVGGVVQVIYKRDTREELRKAIQYVKSYLQEAAPILEAKTYMEMLREQSLVDQLTGLYNRRYLDESIATLSSQVIRRGSIMGILMIDIDFFKKINDDYGHDAGDMMLQRVTAIIKMSVRESDVVIRYGGEEMMVLLMDVQCGFSLEIAEKIRKNVEETVLEVPGKRLHKTVSVGVSEFPVQSDKFWQCVKFADIALYRCKEEGRNRVLLFDDAMWTDKEY